MNDGMDIYRRRVLSVLEAAEAWVTAVFVHGGGELTKMARDTFLAELDAAVTADREAVEERDELRNMLLRVLDAVALLDHQGAVAEAVAIMRDARGHYGIEETGGPGQAATEWDEIVDRMQAFVYRYGEQQE